MDVNRSDLEIQGDEMVNPSQKALRIRLHVGSRVYFAIRRESMEINCTQSHDRRYIFRPKRCDVAGVPVLNSLTHGLGFVAHDGLTVFNFYLTVTLQPL